MKVTAANPVHIVMADDDEDDYIFFKKAAENACEPNNPIVNYAANWLELLSYLDRKPLPGIIFLDLNMPVKNGIECLKSIREEEKYNDIAIVIYTTSNAAKDIEEAYKNGANYYAVKPSIYEGIVNIVNKVCAISKAELLMQPVKERFVIT